VRLRVAPPPLSGGRLGGGIGRFQPLPSPQPPPAEGE
jgi:hypothetical protein